MNFLGKVACQYRPDSYLFGGFFGSESLLGLHGKRPDQYSFDFGLWTRQIVRELVHSRFGVELSLASIGALLARLGLTPQKPLPRAYQRDELQDIVNNSALVRPFFRHPSVPPHASASSPKRSSG